MGSVRDAVRVRSKESSPFNVPPVSIVSLEHPCIVKNVDNAIKSLGGEQALDKFLPLKEHKKVIGVKLRPDDSLAKPIASQSLTHHPHVLLKISVPKQTGRKRKKGSSGPFLTNVELEDGQAERKRPRSEPSLDPRTVLRSMRDNPKDYRVRPIGTVTETHRFRYLPDFQYTTRGSPLCQQIRESLIPFDYETLKTFKIDPTRELLPGHDVGPPPEFSQATVHFNWSYRQNPTVQYVTDASGRVKGVNVKAQPKVQLINLSYDAETVPSGPPEDLEPERKLEPRTRVLLAQLRKHFETRPIMTRRVILNLLNEVSEWDIKRGYVYLGYTFNDGPWRDTLIKYGVDPRKDRGCRFYQTLVFKFDAPIDKNSAGAIVWKDGTSQWKRSTLNRFNKRAVSDSHLFDGIKVVADGRIWQLCDVTEPLLKELINFEATQEESNELTGWYHNGTMAKLKVLMREMLRRIIEGEPLDVDCRKLMTAIPDVITLDDNYWEKVPRDMSRKEHNLASAIRNIALEARFKRPGLRDSGGSGEGQEDQVEATSARSQDVEEISDHSSDEDADDDSDPDALGEGQDDEDDDDDDDGGGDLGRRA